jgi:hypothetical protein
VIISTLTGIMMLVGAVEYSPFVAELVDSVNPDSITAIIEGLSGEVAVTIDGEPDSIPCRFALSEGSDRAALWLAERFEACGFAVELVPFIPHWSSETRPLPLGVESAEELAAIYNKAQSSIGPDTMWNVVATLPGEDSAQVILCAHYDAISNDPWEYTPGADDNASGVATVLEAARLMGTHNWQHTLRFVLFSGEELGLLGSEAYVGEAVERGDAVLGAFNTDMIGWDADDNPEMDIHCDPVDQASQDMGYEIAELMDVYDLNISPEFHIYDAIEASDHYWFWMYGIPAILLIEDWDDFNPFYHQTTDLLGVLNKPFMTEGVKAAVSWAATEAVWQGSGYEEERPIHTKEGVSLRLSSDVIFHTGWLEVRSPYAVRPVIYDASGRQVKVLGILRPSAEPVRKTLDVSELPEGVYWVSVSGVEGPLSQRFVLLR